MPSTPNYNREPWPPNYNEVWRRKDHALAMLKANPYGAKKFYSKHAAEFIADWIQTYDPRLAGSGTPATLPFILFKRQVELVGFLQACLEAKTSGLVEKARDMGATWVCAGFSLWLWLFVPGAAIGWGSRKEEYVDQLGNPKSIFEKMRMALNDVPRIFLPIGFNPRAHMTYMKFINPETGATIAGEAGDNIGRGGRTLMYFKDESAHYERPEKIEAALGDNTNVQIDISSVNGLGNVFHRRRENGIDWAPGEPMLRSKTYVFVMDWRDHPGKDQLWFEMRRNKAIEEGLLHVFAQEVERNYAASVENVIIPHEWVKACIDAHITLGFDDSGSWGGALDVADEGADRNALALRKGSVLKHCEDWGDRDVGETTRRALGMCEGKGHMHLQYDSIGIGAGVKSEANRLADDDLMPEGVRLIPWNAAAAVQKPDDHLIPGDRDSPLNKDFYENLKAQAWWQLRLRCWRTYRAITEGIEYDPSELISFSSEIPKIRALEKELSQAVSKKSGRMKLMVDKSPEGTRSPNLADAVVMAFWPANIGSFDLDSYIKAWT